MAVRIRVLICHSIVSEFDWKKPTKIGAMMYKTTAAHGNPANDLSSDCGNE